ncbi:cohesin domain-containing protein [Paenibacillus eucommiae]|uniref:Dockerin domain-containing protein n=1 Tax=Paenibacillus eucommiae TaxID=1355755 RepID=A0ABS4JAW4_9BACL|nr:cohesin domain-containing protein [Paenibacillus eucommiae]MBP1996988.1 hypothetical protein [Paenibacillus eucommiae]
MKRKKGQKRLGLFAAWMAIGMLFGSTVQASSNPTPTVAGEFPIGIFWNPPPSETSDASYADIRAMNANFIVATNLLTTPATTDWALEKAANNDLKILVTDTGVRWYKSEWVSQNSDSGAGVYLRNDRTLGQTFLTPNQTDMAVWKLSFKKSGAWPSGTTATISIYNSPAKTTLIGTSTLAGPIESNYPEFNINGAVVAPNTTYYMELTTNSTTDLGPFKTSTSDAYSGGQAYINGSPQANDLYFQMTLPRNGGGNWSAFSPTSDLSDEYIEAFVNHYKSNPALLGYNLVDEPFGDIFPTLKKTTDKIRTLDPDHMAYVNLYALCEDCFHYYTGSNDFVNGGYQNYVNGWLDTNPDIISFDEYPFREDGVFDEVTHYKTLEYFRERSLLYDTDLWAYIQSMKSDYFGMVQPTESQMRFQIYSTLAYGAKGFVYYTYHTAGTDDAIILPDGSKNVTYNYAKNINAEVLNLGTALLSLTSKDVYHTGGVPPFARALPSTYFWQPSGTGPEMPMIVSRFENEDGREYVMVVNKDMENAHSQSFALSTLPDSVREVSKTTGLETTAAYNAGTGVLSADFAPGEGRLYVLDEEAPASAELKTTITGVSPVQAGNKFTVQVGLSGVTGSVYAQDIKLDYDPAVMEFVSAKSLKQGIKVVRTIKEPVGKLRLLIASEGAGHGITGTEEIVELTFKAKTLTQTASGVISISSATLGDVGGNETEAASSSLSMLVTSGGSGNNAGDINHDGKVSVGDLSIVAANYGKNSSSPDWEQVKQADLNKDGKIDIEDLAAVARRIAE